MAHVHIVTSDSGWILERLAREIADRLDYVTYSTQIDDTAAIQYYITYGARRRRVSKIEAAFFAHLERDPATRERFFAVADDIECCVCMADLYAQMLRDHGARRVVTLAPGVDFDENQPKVKIGVVGRTYHTGRKGEALVQAVYDTPGIEWHFTGEGWPGPARHVPHGEMGRFYNEMDYILVPALYEGGPMCVPEALACGTPVIAPPVGWVPDFPHIEYKTGDAEDLRRALREVVAERQAMRAKVLDRSWDAWARGHDELFRSLLAREGLTPSPVASAGAGRIGEIALLLHGAEGKTLGGPSVRVPQTARHLRELGYEVQTGVYPDPIVKSAAIVHGFNVWAPQTGVEMARGVKAQGKPFVLSSIFLDLSEREFWQNQIPALFREGRDPDEIDRRLAALRAKFLRDGAERRLPIQGAPGHFEAVREMVEIADHVILLAENERRALDAIGARPRAATVVRNAVDPERFGTADPELFAREFGVKDYVVCVARLEARKNQLMLLHALRDLDLPIVLVGHGQDKGYQELLERYARANVTFVGRIDPASPLLPSAVAGARVFTLPSWSEGAPLAALEAAASGANMVLSDRSAEREYFGGHARYCDPADPASIRRAILEAYDSPSDEAARRELREIVARDYSWSRYARETAEVYRRTLADVAPAKPAPAKSAPEISTKAPAASPPAIVIDVTTSCYHKGRWTGISRFETSLAQALARRDDLDVHFIAWHDATRRFVRISPHAVNPETLAVYHDHAGKAGLLPERLPRGARLIAGGSAWMQNSRYAAGLVEFAQGAGLMLTLVIHDIIPCVKPFWFAEGYAPVFERNLSLLLRGAHQILAGSRYTRADIERFAFENSVELPAIGLIRYGDDIGAGTPADSSGSGVDPAIVEKFSARPFVLNVGAIHARKNHRLLYDLWSRLVDKLGKRCPRLVIVGGVAWNGGDVARAFREDKRLADVVHILDHIDDAALDWLYDHALFTVYPSLYEGWGLPVAESLSRGKICVAAKASSVPEIAPDLTDLVDPMDFTAWLTQITMYLTSAAAREARIRAEYRGRSWDQSVEDLLVELKSLAAEEGPRRRYVMGSRASLSDKDPFNALCKLGGWHPSESWGAWTSARTAYLGVRFARPPEGALTLTVVIRALAAPTRCDFLIDGETIGSAALLATQPRFSSFRVPARLAQGRAALTIEIRSSELAQVKQVVANSKDERRVGVALLEFALTPERDFIVADLNLDAALLADAIPVGERFWLPGVAKLDRFFATPMALSEAWGARAVSGAPKFVIKTHDLPDAELDLEIVFRAVASAAAPYSALIVAPDGTVVGRLEANDASLRTTRMRLDRRVRALGSPLLLEVVSAPAKSPAALTIGAETAAFGVGFFALGLAQAGATPAARVAPRSAIDLGEPLDFRAGRAPEAGAAYLVEGCWHRIETRGVWSLGAVGRLTLPLAQAPAGDLLVSMRARKHQIDGDAPARLAVRVNGGAPIDVVALADEWADVRIDRDSLALDPAAPILTLDIETAEVASPFELAGHKDDRLIGVFLSDLVVRDWAPAVYGTPISAHAANADAVVRLSDAWALRPQGWLLHGETGRLTIRTTQDGQARMLAAVVNLSDAPVELTVAATRGGADDAAERGATPITLAPGAQALLDQAVEAREGAATLAFSARADALLVTHAMIAAPDDAEALSTLRRASLALPPGAAAPIRLNETLPLAPGSPLVDALAGAWHKVEPDGAWMDGRPAGFRLTPPADLDGPVALDVVLGVFGDFALGPRDIAVKVGAGETRIVRRVGKERRAETFVVTPQDLSAETGSLDVTFWSEHGASPLELGLSVDPRRLAIFVASVALRPTPTTIEQAPDAGLAERSKADDPATHASVEVGQSRDAQDGAVAEREDEVAPAI